MADFLGGLRRTAATPASRLSRRDSPAAYPERWRQVAATAVPAVMPPLMSAVFRAAVTRFGNPRGLQFGFAVYWATCWALAGLIAGPRRLTAAFRRADFPLTDRPVKAAAVLAVPPVGAALTELLPNLRRAGPAALAVSVGVAATNAVAEEALWRAMPVSVFPDSRVQGWLWPAVGFAAWHLAPLAASQVPARRAAAVLLGAGWIGVGSGWVAHRTGSVAAVVGPHVLTDACGVRAVRRIWLAGN